MKGDNPPTKRQWIILLLGVLFCLLLVWFLTKGPVTNQDKAECEQICGDSYTMREYDNGTITKIFCECRDFLGNGITATHEIRVIPNDE